MYEWLLAVHILAAGLWFGSGVSLLVVGRRVMASGREAFAQWVRPATWWGGRAHPAAGLVLLLTGPGIVSAADYDFGEPWIVIALVGLFVLFAIGGGLVGRTAGALDRAIDAGDGAAVDTLGRKLLSFTVLEMAILTIVIVDMVVKPGL
jgi:hypothetical protein